MQFKTLTGIDQSLGAISAVKRTMGIFLGSARRRREALQPPSLLRQLTTSVFRQLIGNFPNDPANLT